MEGLILKGRLTMIGVLITFIITIILMITCILKHWTIRIKNFIVIDAYLVVTFVGTIIALILARVKPVVLINAVGANNAINPLKIIILLLSLTFISISLDVLGFFNYLAVKIVAKVKHSQFKLFFTLMAIIGLLTIITSNDIIILTFTIFICYFAKATKINPLPYLISEFVIANTCSMLLIIGNPTNIYLATYSNVDFLAYLKVMWLPTLLATIASLIVLPLLFFKQLKKPFEAVDIAPAEVYNRPLVIINLVILLSVTVMLAISHYLRLEMWIITLIGAFLLLLIELFFAIFKHDFYVLTKTLSRLPLALGVFVLIMFSMTTALKEAGILNQLQTIMIRLTNDNQLVTTICYGAASTVTDNLINNIPMSLGFVNLIEGVNPTIQPYALFATIIGSNIGAYLTPIGALAGIMWQGILKRQDIEYSYFAFLKNGLILSSVILIVSLIGLYIIL